MNPCYDSVKLLINSELTVGLSNRQTLIMLPITDITRSDITRCCIQDKENIKVSKERVSVSSSRSWYTFWSWWRHQMGTCANNRVVGDLTRHRAHYGVTVMMNNNSISCHKYYFLIGEKSQKNKSNQQFILPKYLNDIFVMGIVLRRVFVNLALWNVITCLFG